MDKDKVIKALEEAVQHYERYSGDEYGREFDYARVVVEVLEDALELLKAQEPREPHYTKLEYIVNGLPVAIQHPECPKCFENGLTLWDAEIEKGAAYCKRCGQAVKWDG